MTGWNTKEKVSVCLPGSFSQLLKLALIKGYSEVKALCMTLVKRMPVSS